MFSRTSWASWDLFRMTPLSFTAVCILLTLDWFLQKGDGHCTRPTRLGASPGLHPICPFTLTRKGPGGNKSDSDGFTALKAPREAIPQENRVGNWRMRRGIYLATEGFGLPTS